jgi:hypothetical protein
MTYIQQAKAGRLVVLQSKAQSLHYQKFRREESDLVLPIGPGAMYETEICGWRYCSLGDLWSDEQYQIEKEINENLLDELIKNLNKYSRCWKPELNLEIGNYYAFQLWVIIGQIQHTNFIVRSIIKTLKPEKVLCYSKANPVPFLKLRPDPDCLFGEVLGRSRLNKDGVCEFIKINERVNQVSSRQRLLSLLPVPLRKFLSSIRRKNSLKKSKNATKKLLVVGGSGDWIKLSSCREFNEYFRLCMPPEIKSGPEMKGSQELVGLLNASILRDQLIPYDISSLASAIYSDMQNFANRVRDIDLLINKYDALVTAVLAYPLDNFFAHRAALSNLPVLVWQHGEKGQNAFDPTSIYTELYYATDYLAYAPVVVEQYKSWIGKYRLRNVIAAGSLDKQVKWKGGDSILYATGKWFKTTMAVDPDRRLFQAHMKILSYLNNCDDRYTVILKANNTDRLNEIPYQYDNITIEYDRRFTDCLKTAEIVILDTPATTLIEACSTKIAIFVLGGRSEYTDEFLAAVKRRVVWAETPEELVLHIDAYINTGLYQADIEDTTFLSLYGSGETPSRVSETIKDAVWESIKCNSKSESGESYVTTGL